MNIRLDLTDYMKLENFGTFVYKDILGVVLGIKMSLVLIVLTCRITHKIQIFY